MLIILKKFQLFSLHDDDDAGILGSRNLGEAKIDAEDDLEYVFNGLGRAIPDDEIDDDFLLSQRKFKERAANAFEEDLAELRRKRRDIQVVKII